MSLQQYKVLVREFIDRVLNELDISKYEEFVASNCVFHSTKRLSNDLDAQKQSYLENWKFSPDWQIEIEDMIAERDRVAVRATGRGTHQGEFSSPWGRAPPTGKQLIFPWIAIYRISKGKIVESWIRGEGFLFFLQQLRLFPTKTKT